VGAASSRDHLISRLEAAPTGSFFMVTWTFRISALYYFEQETLKRQVHAYGRKIWKIWGYQTQGQNPAERHYEEKDWKIKAGPGTTQAETEKES